jgi:hypothetical protein
MDDCSAPVDRLGLDDMNSHELPGQRLDKNSLERSFGDFINVEPIDAVKLVSIRGEKGWVLGYGCGGLSAGCLGP